MLYIQAGIVYMEQDLVICRKVSGSPDDHIKHNIGPDKEASHVFSHL